MPDKQIIKFPHKKTHSYYIIKSDQSGDDLNSTIKNLYIFLKITSYFIYTFFYVYVDRSENPNQLMV